MKRFVLLIFAALVASILRPVAVSAQNAFGLVRGDLSYGTLEGPGALGEATDVAPLPDGRVAVLDRLGGNIKLFGQSGELVSRFGRPGQGPGEFDYPTSLLATPSGDLMVLDAGNRRISTLTLAADSVVLSSEITIDFLARDMCLLGEDLFLLGAREGRGIHQLGRNGRIVRSFDSRPTPRDAIERTVERHEVSGYLVCDGALGWVAVLPLIRSKLRVFSRAGRPLGEVELPEYRETRFEVPSQGSIRMSLDPESGTVHEALGLVSLNGSLLVQVGEKNLAGPVGTPRSWLVTEDLSLVDVAPVPAAIRASRDEAIFVSPDALFPVLELWHLRRGG